MRHLLSKGASPNTSDDEVLLQLALKYLSCGAVNRKTNERTRS